jgi:hypothetical protein
LIGTHAERASGPRLRHEDLNVAGRIGVPLAKRGLACKVGINRNGRARGSPKRDQAATAAAQVTVAATAHDDDLAIAHLTTQACTINLKKAVAQAAITAALGIAAFNPWSRHAVR